MTDLAFIHRLPTPSELEQLRLVLSTFQDGSGMLAQEDGRTLPGWRDFERSVAAVFGGVAQENKAIFDVLIPDPTRPSVFFGISCKMRQELRRARRDGRVLMELSNSSKKFRDYIQEQGIVEGPYSDHPGRVGKAVVELVERWKANVSVESGGNIDLSRSCYLTLLYDLKSGEYQLFWHKIHLPAPDSLMWRYVSSRRSSGARAMGHLIGSDNLGVVFEWYGESGGQLKYYPLASQAVWVSRPFALESLANERPRLGLLDKARRYFANQWP